MARLLSLLTDPRKTARLERVLRLAAKRGAGHSREIAGSWADVRRIARQCPPDLLVCEIESHTGEGIEDYTALQLDFPSVGTLVYADFSAWPARDILHLANHGILGAITFDLDDDPVAFQQRLDEAMARTLTGTVGAAFAEIAPPDLKPLIEYLVAEAFQPLTPHAVAAHCCQHPKTLREHLRRAGLPSTNRLIVWARLLNAAHLIQDRGRSVENVVRVLRFPSASALRAQLQRYAGVSPERLKGQGGSHLLMKVLRRRFEQGWRAANTATWESSPAQGVAGLE